MYSVGFFHHFRLSVYFKGPAYPRLWSLMHLVIFFFPRYAHGLNMHFVVVVHVLHYLNPLTPISNQERISPYHFSIISSRQVMRIKKNMSKRIMDY